MNKKICGLVVGMAAGLAGSGTAAADSVSYYLDSSSISSQSPSDKDDSQVMTNGSHFDSEKFSKVSSDHDSRKFGLERNDNEDGNKGFNWIGWSSSSSDHHLFTDLSGENGDLDRCTATSPSCGNNLVNVTPPTSVVPVPAAVWLLASGLIGMVGIGRRRHSRMR